MTDDGTWMKLAVDRFFHLWDLHILYMHTHTLTTHSPLPSLSHTHKHTCTQTHTHTPILTITHTYTLNHSNTHSHTPAEQSVTPTHRLQCPSHTFIVRHFILCHIRLTHLP